MAVPDFFTPSSPLFSLAHTFATGYWVGPEAECATVSDLGGEYGAVRAVCCRGLLLFLFVAAVAVGRQLHLEVRELLAKLGDLNGVTV